MTTPTTKQKPRKPERFPMASALGADLQPGDRVGSVDPWVIGSLNAPLPGACAAPLPIAGAGLCDCYRQPDPEVMPRRVATGRDGTSRVVFDHLRYALVDRRFR